MLSEFYIDESEIDQSQWEKYVFNHSNGNIFQTPAFYNIHKNTPGFKPILLATLKNGEIESLLVSVLFSEMTGLIGKLTKRSIIPGILFSNEENALRLLKIYEKKFKDNAFYTRIISVKPDEKTGTLFYGQGYKLNERLNYFIKLDRSEEEIWKSINNTRRRQIGRGYKRGINVKISFKIDNLDHVYNLIKSIYENKGLPIQNFEYFINANKYLSENKNIIYFLAYHENHLIGCRIILLYKETVYDWFAGDNLKYRDKYTNDVLIWEVLRWGSQNGYKVFNFGGAGEQGKEYGVREFKKKFGGDMVVEATYIKIHNKLRFLVLSKLSSIYKFFKTLK